MASRNDGGEKRGILQDSSLSLQITSITQITVLQKTLCLLFDRVKAKKGQLTTWHRTRHERTSKLRINTNKIEVTLIAWSINRPRERVETSLILKAKGVRLPFVPGFC